MRQEGTHKHTGRGHVVTEAEAGVAQPQVREGLEYQELGELGGTHPESPQKVIWPCPWCCHDACSNALGRDRRGRKRTNGAPRMQWNVPEGMWACALVSSVIRAWLF